MPLVPCANLEALGRLAAIEGRKEECVPAHVPLFPSMAFGHSLGVRPLRGVVWVGFVLPVWHATGS